MELCYIWISEFRNFKNEGFNFSTESYFNYSPETNKLDVTPNPNYLKDFFYTNIINITGIIGKNGAGKTNLLELVNYVLNEGSTKIAAPFIIIFRRPNKFYGLYYGMEMPECLHVKLDRYDGGEGEVTPIYFSNSFDGRNHSFPKRTIALTTNSFLENIFRENIHISYQRDIVNQLRFVGGKNYTYLLEADKLLNKETLENITPDRIVLTSPTWGNITHRARKFQEQISEVYPNDRVEFLEFVANFRKQISKDSTGENLISLFGFLTILDFIMNEFRLLEPPSDVQTKAFGKKYKGKRKPVRHEYKLFEFKKYNKSSLSELRDYLFIHFPKLLDEHFPYQFERAKFLFDLPKYSSIKFIRKDEGKNSNRKIQYETDFNPIISRLIYNYFEVTTQLNLNINIDWVGISSGHKAFINLFGRFQSLITKNRIKQENVLICIDEGDLYFHPKWQIEFLFKVQHVLSNMFSGRKIQIILTTHSPFLVSDLPKDNLIFLEKTNSHQTKVIPKSSLQFETFGGNIGELYLDAFFIESGLISSFAAEKIRKLITSAKEGSLNSQDRILIDKIGEEIIKQQLKNMIGD